ncbi:hypothetical protein BpHYR1_044554 [Brachionus plicatilis]|uniref:SWIM-type domain-containing protein n=1 Tax=Brachionus plicatilis TaxID=10195 RepID=A0A3M7R208_BRAPC|nr:hypothetical protein BpHYR1_044554 [Brachionus plicatilis]
MLHISFDSSLRRCCSFSNLVTILTTSSVCSCPDKDKNLICKHVIGVIYRLKLCEFPGLDLNLEAKNKQGRRKLATHALAKLDYQNITPNSCILPQIY